MYRRLGLTRLDSRIRGEEEGGLSGLVSGNLRSGFVATDGGQAVFVLTEEHVVQKYQLP